MKKYQFEFIELVIEMGVLRFGNFFLKSGRKSPYFFNSGLFNTGYSLVRLGRFYADALVHSGIKFDILFGAAYKGIPIVTSTAISLADSYGINTNYCFNRKEEKTYAEGGNLIGGKIKGRVILLDDVVTSGSAIRKSMEIVQANNSSTVGILIALDRQEKGDNKYSAIDEIQKDFDCPIISIIKLIDILTYLKDKEIFKVHFRSLQKYYSTHVVE
ncbi:orotate phosphoribosyltransferase [Candidatus Photodesmus katoptron]|uniref:Orotate phosphoribosyltransferase n=1 Tax=Candidatus Photodesmus katoptron Akat1 TaxID=1236703 RepID=S3DZS0_9GAMM|nr:orotate phosphoribosyltransferase [Candidatus Photodesmus katoptron]EPE37461.1 orotate phosphoribosyltransferase [Candidatus Photodesmus katoptron Akat1]KEY90290.1 orotate phosphoribosyltransferase [Candidatus Photodesmus katoptron]